MRLGVVQSWEALNTAVLAFDAEQARLERTRRLAAAAVVPTVPEAEVKLPSAALTSQHFPAPHGRVRRYLPSHAHAF